MSRIIASLSGKHLEEVQQTISRLEDLSGLPSEDVRHLAETSQALRQKINELGLDPDDTTGEELYHALSARYDIDARRIDKAVGVNKESPLAERIDKAGELVAHSVEAKDIWCLKSAVAKKLIRKNPPKKLMKRLHYRSIDSLLKREDAATIFIGADIYETAVWHKKLETALARLGSDAYELRAGRVVSLKTQEFADCDRGIIINGVMGAVAVSPSIKTGTPVLTIALLIIDGLESLNEDTLDHRLYSAHPTLSWWLGTEHLSLQADDGLVSLNFKDVALNHHQSNDYKARLTDGSQHEFWRGLMNRYRTYLDQLPSEVMAVENELGEHLRPQRELVPEPIEVEV